MSSIQFRDTSHVDADAATGTFSGYASRFWSVDSYGTAFAPGAFTKTLSERGSRIPVLYQHDPSLNVGVPLSLTEDGDGLAVEARLFDDGADGTTLLKRLRQGARYGMSFGFRTLQDRAVGDADRVDLTQMPEMTRSDVRVITEVKLYEVSVVSFPANETADIVAVRDESFAVALHRIADALRSGSVTSVQRAALAALLAEQEVAPDADGTPRDEPDSPARRRDADLAIARWRHMVN